MWFMSAPRELIMRGKLTTFLMHCMFVYFILLDFFSDVLDLSNFTLAGSEGVLIKLVPT